MRNISNVNSKGRRFGVFIINSEQNLGVSILDFEQANTSLERETTMFYYKQDQVIHLKFQAAICSLLYLSLT